MKKLLIIALFAIAATASEIVTETAQTRMFGKRLDVNAKVVQLSNQKQQIVSRLGGHLEAYHVEPGEKVAKGDDIATIKSLELSRMSSQYLALGEKVAAARERLASTKRLYRKGLASKQDLDRERMRLASVEAERNTLKTQLLSLGIDLEKLKKPTDTFVIRAHADGIVEHLFVPSHTNIGSETPIASLVQSQGYYAIAYLAVDDAMAMKSTTKGELKLGKETYPCRMLYLLPKVDEETQRARVLFMIETERKGLLLNAFAPMAIAMPPEKQYVAVKRSGLTMFENEWVVFVPVEEKAHERGHDEAEHGEEEEHHDEAPYEARVVEVVTTFGDYAAVKGIEPGEKYVSDGVYFVKSMMLKSELGEHGH